MYPKSEDDARWTWDKMVVAPSSLPANSASGASSAAEGEVVSAVRAERFETDGAREALFDCYNG